MAVPPIPNGYHTVTPYLYIKGAAQAIEYYKKAFGAVETMRMDMPGGKLGHAEIKIGDSAVMLADEQPQMDIAGPETRGGATTSFVIYVKDVDSAYQQALAAGGTEIRAVQNMFYGDRVGVLRDPFGHVWSLATHVEDVPKGELRKRLEDLMKNGKCN